jgi:hypothetical protein
MDRFYIHCSIRQWFNLWVKQRFKQWFAHRELLQNFC